MTTFLKSLERLQEVQKRSPGDLPQRFSDNRSLETRPRAAKGTAFNSMTTFLKSLDSLPEVEKRSPKATPEPLPPKHDPEMRKRRLKAAAFIALGVATIAGGIAVLGYRGLHLVIDNGIINSRIVRLRSPIDGEVQDFYAQPGVLVKSKQVLARIQRSLGEEQTLLQLQERVEIDTANLDSAKQLLEMFNRQLKNLQTYEGGLQIAEAAISSEQVNGQQAILEAAIARAQAARENYLRYQAILDDGLDTTLASGTVNRAQAELDGAIAEANAVRANYQRHQQLLGTGMDVEIVSQNVEQKQAQLDSAIAEADVARSDYQRYASLLDSGAISAQRVDRAKADWDSAEAEIRRSQAALDQAQSTLDATASGVSINSRDIPEVVSQERVEELQSEWETAQAKVVRARTALAEAQAKSVVTQSGVSVDGSLVSREQVEELKFQWEAAESEVQQAQAAIDGTQTRMVASTSGMPTGEYNATKMNLQAQRLELLQKTQEQSNVVATLQTQIDQTQLQLKNAQSPYNDTQKLEMVAPFSGVVYQTERERGEKLNKSEFVLSLIDCNELWVEVILNAKQASRIDVNKPVRVQVEGYGSNLNGEVALMQPVSSIQAIEERTRLMQVQAIAPAIPPNFVGQPLTRVTVKIPPPPNAEQSMKFCGVGQAANLTFRKTSPFGQ
ncbi:MAG: HlyD family efflux transporter periplasmic adaptor subunit [Geitlerinemataceae cyanobacterium]